MSLENSENPRGERKSPADLGAWLLDKWWHRLNDSGKDFQTVARQMRKQDYRSAESIQQMRELRNILAISIDCIVLIYDASSLVAHRGLKRPCRLSSTSGAELRAETMRWLSKLKIPSFGWFDKRGLEPKT